MTKVSVVILNFNYARFLSASIGSALDQTHDDVEVIVVDDASTDDSVAVIEAYGDTITPVLHPVNRGQGAGVNSGAGVASGDLVWFLDADDLLMPDACAVAVAALGADGTMAKFHTPLAIIDRVGARSGETLPAKSDRLATGHLIEHVREFRNHGWPPMSGNAFTAETLRRILPVPEEVYRQAADSFLCEQAVLCGSIHRSVMPFAAYRVHGDNQFAGQPPSLPWLRTKIEREQCSHERLGLLARQLQIEGFDADPTVARDAAFIGYRLASLRIDRAGHPNLGTRPDRRWGLAAAGLRAAWSNPAIHPLDQIARSLWFIAAAAVPAAVVERFFSWYLPDGPSPPPWTRRRRSKQVPAASAHPAPSQTLKEIDMQEPSGEPQQVSSDPNPEVTIVVTPRERFGLSRAALESIYQHTKVPFRLVYVDGNAPRSVGRYLEQAAADKGFELISSGNHLSPNQARNLGLAKVTTPYVAFVDNDLIVTDGWLGRLIDCAEETGAWVVGPLYFEGDPGHRIVHMAGGDYAFEGVPGQRSFQTVHRLQGIQLDEGPVPFTREQVDFVEFHCLLAKTDVVAELGGLDQNLLSSREHLDLCLAVEAGGGKVYFEPESWVTYRTPPPIDLGDIPFYLRRWSEAWNEASLDHFCNKHGIAPSYTDRIVGMRARRQLLLEPVRRASSRVFPERVDRFAMRVLARLEREVNSAIFRLPDHAR